MEKEGERLLILKTTTKKHSLKGLLNNQHMPCMTMQSTLSRNLGMHKQGLPSRVSNPVSLILKVSYQLVQVLRDKERTHVRTSNLLTSSIKTFFTSKIC